MIAAALLAHLKAIGVEVWASDGEIRYRARPGLMTPELRGQLRANRAEILRYLSGAAEAVLSAAPFPVAERSGDLELTFAQQRLWFLEQWQPGSARYHIASAVRLRGPLDTAALAGSLNLVVARHEALRTCFPAVDGQPVQRILSSAEVPLRQIDLSGAAPLDCERHALTLAEEDSRRPFDLAEAPLLRALLVRIGPELHLLVLTLHHIVADGWSLGIVLSELAEAYAAHRQGLTPQLPAVKYHCADIGAWQRKRWREGELAGDLQYWRNRLAGAGVLTLPTDRVRPAQRRYPGAVIKRRLADGPAIAAISRELGTTPFMTLLVGFAALLARYTGQDDIVVGTPVANRVSRESEGVIGCLVNTLVMRIDARGNPRLRELAARVREAALDGYAHQETPFEALVEALDPAREASRHPLFDVLFGVQNTPVPAAALAGLEMEAVEVNTGGAKFDLTVLLEETAAGWEARAEYDEELYERDTIERLLASITRLEKSSEPADDPAFSRIRS
jgi:non-ribosomal peptide synthetase component F